jgi:hypothetical protein
MNSGDDRDPIVVHNFRALLSWVPFIGCLAAGLVGLVGACGGFNTPEIRATGHNFNGLYCIGSALAFGLLCNAVLRR